MKRLIIGVVAVVALGACGGSGSSEHGWIASVATCEELSTLFATAEADYANPTTMTAEERAEVLAREEAIVARMDELGC